YPPGRWNAGEYIRDVQPITLSDWNSDRAIFYLGLWKGEHRLAIRRGDNDGENRVRAASIEIGSGPAAAADPGVRAAPRPQEPPPVRPPPEMNAVRASGTITIDGRL